MIARMGIVSHASSGLPSRLGTRKLTTIMMHKYDAIHAINFSGPGKTKRVAVRRCSQDTNHALGSAKFASRYVSNCFVSSFGVDTANP